MTLQSLWGDERPWRLPLPPLHIAFDNRMCYIATEMEGFEISEGK